MWGNADRRRSLNTIAIALSICTGEKGILPNRRRCLRAEACSPGTRASSLGGFDRLVDGGIIPNNGLACMALVVGPLANRHGGERCELRDCVLLGGCGRGGVFLIATIVRLDD
jgi:hypothetical protein